MKKSSAAPDDPILGEKDILFRLQAALEQFARAARLLRARRIGQPAVRRDDLRHQQRNRTGGASGRLQRRRQQVADREHGQRHRQHRALPRSAHRPDSSALPQYQFLADVQPETKALASRLRGVRGLKTAVRISARSCPRRIPQPGVPTPPCTSTSRFGSCPGTCARTVTEPFAGVNLIALSSRMMRIWRTRVGSAHTNGRSAAISVDSVICLAAAALFPVCRPHRRSPPPQGSPATRSPACRPHRA